MNTNETNKTKYLRWELMLLVIVAWMGMLLGTSIDSNSNPYSALIVSENNPGDEISAKLMMFIEFVHKNKSDETALNRQYVNKGLIYLSGVLNAIIKKQYGDNEEINNQREKLLEINEKILKDDSLSAITLKKSLMLSSKIISFIQSYEFPNLNKASKDLRNSAREIAKGETSRTLKFKTADFFEKSSDIFIAMAIIKAHRSSRERKEFYKIRST